MNGRQFHMGAIPVALNEETLVYHPPGAPHGHLV